MNYEVIKSNYAVFVKEKIGVIQHAIPFRFMTNYFFNYAVLLTYTVYVPFTTNYYKYKILQQLRRITMPFFSISCYKLWHAQVRKQGLSHRKNAHYRICVIHNSTIITRTMIIYQFYIYYIISVIIILVLHCERSWRAPRLGTVRTTHTFRAPAHTYIVLCFIREL